jgi:lactose PTS system EIIA component
MSISKEDAYMIAFEIVSFAGEARSKLLIALTKAGEGKYEEAENLAEEARKSLLKAHEAQTEMLSAEARGETSQVSFMMVHAQDHLMTAMLLKDLMKHLIHLYKNQANNNKV